MENPPSISEMVARAVSSGLRYTPPERRRDKAAREAEQRALRILSSYNPADDSDFDDYFISDYVWNKRYKYEEEEFDQLIFNVLRQDKINTQERKVHVNTAICIRDCPEKAEEIAMWTKFCEPVLSKAPKKRKQVDQEKAKRDAELDKILAEAVEEMTEQPRVEEKSFDKRLGSSQPKKRRSRKNK